LTWKWKYFSWWEMRRLRFRKGFSCEPMPGKSDRLFIDPYKAKLQW
jgi:hypothetical protein